MRPSVATQLGGLRAVGRPGARERVGHAAVRRATDGRPGRAGHDRVALDRHGGAQAVVASSGRGRQRSGLGPGRRPGARERVDDVSPRRSGDDGVAADRHRCARVVAWRAAVSAQLGGLARAVEQHDRAATGIMAGRASDHRVTVGPHGGAERVSGRAIASAELRGLGPIGTRERVDRALVARVPGGAGDDRVALDRHGGAQAVARGRVHCDQRGRLRPGTARHVEHLDGALVPHGAGIAHEDGGAIGGHRVAELRVGACAQGGRRG